MDNHIEYDMIWFLGSIMSSYYMVVNGLIGLENSLNGLHECWYIYQMLSVDIKEESIIILPDDFMIWHPITILFYLDYQFIWIV